MATTRTSQDSDGKLKELILYVSQKCAQQARFGATKLNKTLFYSDFLSYATRGRAITGTTYMRLPKGPAPRRLLPVRGELVNSGDLAIQEVDFPNGLRQKRTVNLRNPDLSAFTAEEIALVDYVIEKLRDTTAEEVSDLSHRMVGWKAVGDHQEIPYNTVFVSDAPLSEVEVARGEELAAEMDLFV